MNSFVSCIQCLSQLLLFCCVSRTWRKQDVSNVVAQTDTVAHSNSPKPCTAFDFAQVVICAKLSELVYLYGAEALRSLYQLHSHQRVL